METLQNDGREELKLRIKSNGQAHQLGGYNSADSHIGNQPVVLGLPMWLAMNPIILPSLGASLSEKAKAVVTRCFAISWPSAVFVS